jgi:primase-polymerase (primpol)-like protein
MTAAMKPTPVIKVPDDLAELDCWAVWRMESTKIPYRVDGRRASSTNASDWTDIDRARNAVQTGKYSGLAFAFFAQHGLAGLDLDDCLGGDGEVKSWARRVVERFADTYSEISPSGRGLKIWARGSIPANLPKVILGDGGIEIYDHSRYFTFTGQRFRGAPLQVEDHAADLSVLYEHLHGSRHNRGGLRLIEGGLIPCGRQHSTLVSVCGTLRRRGICDEAIEACLQIVNARQCEKPGSRENISRIVRSSRKWGAS